MLLTIKVLAPVSIYIIKAITYAFLALTTYYQIEFEEMKAPEDIMALITGPLGRAAISIAAIEAVHNLYIFGRKLRKAMVPDSH